jgi:GH25 family lysozyme M1 (1,4-beta-N-acetylmuramidase)
MVKSVDLSRWNGSVDFQKLKGCVSHVILKCIEKSGIEPSFEKNYSSAVGVKMTVDVYNFLYGGNVSDYIQSAGRVLSAIKGKNINRVWLDLERDEQKGKGQQTIDGIIAYKNVIEKAGYKFGVYCSLSSFYIPYIKPYLSQLKDVPMWIARYPSMSEKPFVEAPNEKYKPDVQNLTMWQYTSRGTVAGVGTACDINVIYDAYTPKAVNPYREPITLVKKGDKGVIVKWVQWYLWRFGLLTNSKGVLSEANIDGDFGEKTEVAVKEAQKRLGISVDGIVGEKTRNAFKSTL